MKKLATGIFAALPLCTSIISAYASGQGYGRRFTDANGDGICDRANAACAFVDANENGLCDSCLMDADGCGYGPNFADADEDGVCDQRSFASCPGSGFGNGRGCHRGRNR